MQKEEVGKATKRPRSPDGCNNGVTYGPENKVSFALRDEALALFAQLVRLPDEHIAEKVVPLFQALKWIPYIEPVVAWKNAASRWCLIRAVEDPLEAVVDCCSTSQWHVRMQAAAAPSMSTVQPVRLPPPVRRIRTLKKNVRAPKNWAAWDGNLPPNPPLTEVLLMPQPHAIRQANHSARVPSRLQQELRAIFPGMVAPSCTLRVSLSASAKAIVPFLYCEEHRLLWEWLLFAG